MSHYRRANREGGMFFFTVAMADRTGDLLVAHVDRLRRIYSSVRDRYPFKTVAICVLPDHLHAIWELPPGDADFSGRWSLIKSGFSRGIIPASDLAASKQRRREKGIWQRRYWEHLVRDEDDLAQHVDYIHYNPVKHGLVTAVRDWPYSSFHRFCRDGLLPPDWGGDVREMSGRFGE
ncbi:transposase [Rhodopseudomonas sp. HC1]|uniref:REP-associated tyrosine transposase n=1 Tax=Rhodopseudomonas infernalis TaxID=2897386 RepID=UPI001EE99F27|nr:transposase [Rhodopseudomonas infernalis]MCG6207363.1 transposase [Rhodopseudomonas infernalis]